MYSLRKDDTFVQKPNPSLLAKAYSLDSWSVTEPSQIHFSCFTLLYTYLPFKNNIGQQQSLGFNSNR